MAYALFFVFVHLHFVCLITALILTISVYVWEYVHMRTYACVCLPRTNSSPNYTLLQAHAEIMCFSSYSA